MSIQAEIQAALEADDDLMDILTGGIYTDVEEISRQNTPAAFDSNNEILPCALIKLGTEIPYSGAKISNAVQTPLNIYFYERQGYAAMRDAMQLTFALLNDQKVGTHWRVEFDVQNSDQRDTALDCALGMIRFVVKRRR